MKLSQLYIDDIIKTALLEDINYMDVTTDNLLDDSHRSEAYYVAKDDGVLCGIEIAKRVFDLAGADVDFTVKIKDGEHVKKGDIIAEMTGVYFGTLSNAMGIKTTLKTDDPESPVVTLSARTLDQEAVAQEASQNEDLLALGMALGALQAEGITLDELKADEEFQTAAMSAIKSFIEKAPLTAEKSIDITCEKVKGADGKLYWAPKNLNEVVNFVQGK